MENCIIIDDFIPNDKEKFKLFADQFRKLIKKRIDKDNSERISRKTKTLKSKSGLPIKFIEEIYPDKTTTTLQILTPCDLILEK